MKAVDLVAQQHQKYVLIGNSYHEAEKERHAIEVLIRQRCNALIVHSKALSDRELGEFMEHIPGMVLINRIVPGYAHRCVCWTISAELKWPPACCSITVINVLATRVKPPN